MRDVKLLMDADCLIKVTKAGLKELICRRYEVTIPDVVRREVVDDGRARGFPDAEVVDRNVSVGLIRIAAGRPDAKKGDDAFPHLFLDGGYDAVATDDARLLRRLRATGVPCLVPALLLYRLHRDGAIDRGEAVRGLTGLAPYVSDDEYSTVKLLLEASR